MDKKEEEPAIQERLSLERTIMANQRTFLSFLRTSLYFLVAGLSIHNLLGLKDDNIIHFSLYAISAFLFVVGIIFYFRYKRKCSRVKEFLGEFDSGPFQRKGPFKG